MSGTFIPPFCFGAEVYTWFMKENGKAHANRLDHMIRVSAEAGFTGIEPVHSWMGDLSDPVRLEDELRKAGIDLAAVALVLEWNGPEETEEVMGERTARVTMSVPGVYVPGDGASQLRARLLSISYVGSLSATFLLETTDHPFVGEVVAYDGEGRELGRRETLVYTRSRVRIPLARTPDEETVFLRFEPRGSGRVPGSAPVRWNAPRRDIGEAGQKGRITPPAMLVQKTLRIARAVCATTGVCPLQGSETPSMFARKHHGV